MYKRLLLISFLLLAIAGCDQISHKLGLEDPAVKEARQDGEGKAVGSACRQSGRAIEDCYSIYSWLPKASIYGGWREMDEYMRENKIETIAPQLPPPEPPGTKRKVKPMPVAEAEAPPPKAGDEAAKTVEPGKEAEKDSAKH